MKVLLINGSFRRNGCTFTALNEVAKALNTNGIDTEIFHIGTKAIRGCMGCGVCHEKGECIDNSDAVNECLKLFEAADGIVIASPVHYASSSGMIASFMDPNVLNNQGISFNFKDWTIDAYRRVLENDMIWRGFPNSLFYSAAFTLISVFITLLAAYPMSK